MTNPQTELFNLLAESRLRMGHIRSIQQKYQDSIPDRQDAMLQELNQLRQQIQTAGVGNDSAAEDRYMELLENLRYLDQSYAMNSQLPQPQSQETIPDDLQKALSYGEMLLSVYEGGALVKGAYEDLHYWGTKLIQQPYSVARLIGERLLAIAHEN